MSKKPQMPKRPKASMKVLGRVLKMLFHYYPVLVPITILCIILSSVTAALPPVFMQQVIAEITEWQAIGEYWLNAHPGEMLEPRILQAAMGEIIPKVCLLALFYFFSWIAIILQTQLMAVITQGFLCKLRRTMFEKMQNLPIRYFDTHKHGDIMSHYTNDIDALRELVSQALPSLLQCVIILVSVFFVMLYYSLWMTLILLVGVVAMVIVARKVGGGSAKYFMRQQKAMGKTEGFV